MDAFCFKTSMTCIQFLFLMILPLDFNQGKFLLVNTEEKELYDDNNTLDHDKSDKVLDSESNRIMKHLKNDHKKKKKENRKSKRI